MLFVFSASRARSREAPAQCPKPNAGAGNRKPDGRPQRRSRADASRYTCLMGALPVADADLYELAERTGRALRAAGWRIATAESCTAGWIAKALTDVPGSSQWFECGYVTYSDKAKMRDVGVCARTLATHGAVSEATVRQMAEGALRSSGAQLAVAVSGIAGPDGGTPAKPVGTVWFSVAAQGRRDPQCVVRHFSGDREAVRRQTVAHALRLALNCLGAGASESGGAGVR